MTVVDAPLSLAAPLLSLRRMYENTKELHHAYLIETSKADVTLELFRFLEMDVGISRRGNPDFWHGRFEKFGIDDSRKIEDLASRKIAFGGKRIFVIEAHALSREAQNALLKIMEDTPFATHFFLIMTHADALIPTLRSRLMHIDYEKEVNADARKDATAFLSLSYGKRIAFLKETTLIQDKNAAIGFLNALESEIYRSRGMKDAAALEELICFRAYLYDRSPSVKMILEYLALLLPQI